MIFGDVCVGHKCMDTTVAQPTTQKRARNPRSLKYGLGKVEYLSLTNQSFRVRKSHVLNYMIRTEHIIISKNEIGVDLITVTIA